jgi:hypothetical protein
MVDKRALKILFATYWSSNGWKRKEEQVTLPEDLLYAKQVGVMFDPIRLSHEGIVRRAIEVRGRIEPQAVADAFLASLSTRRLELRSALGSYAVLRHFPTHEHRDRSKQCPICGAYNHPDEHEDLNVLNFERFKWGGVRHEGPVYATFDLERFVSLDPPSPTDADVAIFRRILREIESVPPETTAPQLEKSLVGILPSNKAEREILVNILGYLGVLAVPDHAGFSNGFVQSRERHLPPQRYVEMGYPACWWKARYGIDEAALRSWFPNLQARVSESPCA